MLSFHQQIRNNILEWAIQLEENGIIGNGLTFTKEEQVKAISVTNHIINNFNGDLTQLQIQQNNRDISQSISNKDIYKRKIDMDKIKLLLHEIQEKQPQIEFKNKSNQKNFNIKINILKQEVNSATPNKNKIIDAVASIKKIIESISANLITRGIIHMINQNLI